MKKVILLSFSLLTLNSAHFNMAGQEVSQAVSVWVPLLKTGALLTTVAIGAYKYHQRCITKKFNAAAKNGDETKLRALVREYPRHNVNESNREFIGTLDTSKWWYGLPVVGFVHNRPLKNAIQSKNVEAVRLLLGAGAHIQSEDIESISDISLLKEIATTLKLREKLNSSGILQIVLHRPLDQSVSDYIESLIELGVSTTGRAEYSISQIFPGCIYPSRAKQNLSALEIFWNNSSGMGRFLQNETDIDDYTKESGTYLQNKTESQNRFQALLDTLESRTFFLQQSHTYEDPPSSEEHPVRYWIPQWYDASCSKARNFYASPS